MKKLLLGLVALGASGMLMAQRNNAYPIIPIDSVQYTSSSKLSATPVVDIPDYINPSYLYPNKDTVNIDGIVVFNPQIYALATNTNNPSTSRVSTWLQRKGGGPWSGIQVMLDPANMAPTTTKANLLIETQFYQNCVVGYPVRMTVRYSSFQNETQMYLIRNTPTSDNYVEQLSLVKDTLVYTTITIDSLTIGTPITGQVPQKAIGEKWEGVLVELKDVTVYSRSVNLSNNKRWNWAVTDGKGNVIDIRDNSGYFNNTDFEDTVPKIASIFTPPPVGTKLEYLRGIVGEGTTTTGTPPVTQARYFISPFYPEDMGPIAYSSPIFNSLKKSPAMVKPTDSVTVTASTTKGSIHITGVKLYYAVGYANNQFDSVPMVQTLADTNVWVAKIPTFAAGSIVKYWAKATDANSFSADYPNNVGANSAYLVVADSALTIAQLQYSPYANGATMWNGDTLTNINLRGIVTANDFGSMLAIQDGEGANSAIFVIRSTNDGTNSWAIGDSVEITQATVRENFGTTNLYGIQSSVISSGNPIPNPVLNLSIDSFVANSISYVRPYEAVLARFDGVEVLNLNPDGPIDNFGEFTVKAQSSASLSGMRIDDYNTGVKGLNAKLKVGMPIPSITGLVYFSSTNFKLIPRNLSDIDLSHLDTLAPVITLLGNNPDTVDVGSGAYADLGATAMDNIDGDVTANIVTTGTVNTAAVGSYTLKYKVGDAWGNADSTTRLVVVRDTVSVGVNENEMNFAQLAVFPNPASRELTLTGNFIKTQPVTITVVDLLGKELTKRTVYGTQINETISTESFNNGVYFCTISNASGSKTLKFVVNK